MFLIFDIPITSNEKESSPTAEFTEPPLVTIDNKNAKAASVQ
jgi:hypothetical protein